jgi:fructose-specific phosphotransferase system IIC component
MKKSFILAVFLASVLGIAIGCIDSQPNWDDSGISVLMILLAAIFCGYLAKHKLWLIALFVGIWIPLYGIFSTQNFGSLLALIPAFIGAYVGSWIKELRAGKK